MVKRTKRELYNKRGERRLYDVMFTFSHRKKSYAMINRGTGRRPSCARLKWDIFHGTHIYGNASEEAEYIGGRISARGRAFPERYSFIGEHYSVENDGRMNRIERQCEPWIFGVCADMIPFIFKLVLLLTMLFLWTVVYLGVFGYEWLQVIFPDMETSMLLDVFALFSGILASVIYMLDSRGTSLLFLIVYAMLPSFLITALGIMMTEPVILYIVLGILLLWCAAYVVPHIAMAFRKRGEMRGRILKDVLDYSCFLLILAAVAACVLGAVFNVEGYSYTGESVSDIDNAAIEDNYGAALEKLAPKVWDQLEDAERISALQSICDYECSVILGCDTPTLTASYFYNEELLGKYNHESNTITMNREYMAIADAAHAVSTLLHEIRHAWQYAVVDMYEAIEGDLEEKHKRLELFVNAREFEKNFKYYHSGIVDYDLYYYQPVEMDSREWAEKRLAEFYGYHIYPFSEG